MNIRIYEDGTIEWHFYRKSYRKARWKRAAQREIDDFFRFREEHPGAHGLIIIK